MGEAGPDPTGEHVSVNACLGLVDAARLVDPRPTPDAFVRTEQGEGGSKTNIGGRRGDARSGDRSDFNNHAVRVDAIRGIDVGIVHGERSCLPSKKHPIGGHIGAFPLTSQRCGSLEDVVPQIKTIDG